MSDSDSGVAGGDARSRRARHTPSNRSVRSVAAASLREDIDFSMCYLCEDPFEGTEEKIEEFRGLPFHFGCISAVRCGRRIHAKSGAEALARYDLAMVNQRESWQKDTLPLKKDASGKRPAGVRHQAMQRAKESAEFAEQGKIADMLTLNLVRFC